MRRNNRGEVDEGYEAKKIIYITGAVFLIAIIAFIVTYVVYSNMLNKMDVGEIKTTTITDLGSTDLSEASLSIGKSVNEIKENSNTNQEIQKIAINTSNILSNSTNENTISNIENVKTEETKKVEEKEPEFSKPVEGEILREYASDKLVYSNTLKEWVTHNGIDIIADKTTIVKAAEEGKVKSIKNDPRYGITVVIEHSKDYSTIYSNLLTAEFVKEGESVKKGQTIGTVGNTASFEIADESHLHFEIMKKGEYVDPNLYIN